MNTTTEPRPRPDRRRRERQETRCQDFLDALYIPNQIRVSPEILSSPRCKAGNRTNLLTIAWERAEAKARSLQWAKLLLINKREDADWSTFLRTLAGVSTVVFVASLVGLGLQGRLEARQGRVEPVKSYSMAPTVTRPPEAKPHGTPPATAVAAKVVQNDLGHVVEVRGSDPGSVLTGFCRTMMTMACDPIELAWADPPNPHLRFGVFRSEFTKRAIQIRRLPGTREWVAGDGMKTVESFPASSLRLSDDRVRVRDLR